MPLIKSPWNGAIVSVKENSILNTAANRAAATKVVTNPKISAGVTKAITDLKISSGVTKVVAAPPKTVPAPPTNVGTGSSITQTAQQKRVAEGKNAIYSTVPEIASLQRQARAIYETSGKWDTPEQKSLNAKAESIRKGLNPNYTGGGLGFTDTQYFLPGAGNSTPNIDIAGGLVDKGVSGTVGAVSAITGSTTGIIAAGIIALVLLGRR